MKKQHFSRKFWIGVLVVGLVVILLLAFGRSGQPESPTDKEPGSEPPADSAEELAIKAIIADEPAKIVAVRLEAFDLGLTPTSLTIDQPGIWNIIAVTEDQTKQQEVVISLSPDEKQVINFKLSNSRAWTNPVVDRGGAVTQPWLFHELLAGIGFGDNHLQRVGVDGEMVDLVAKPVQEIVWRDQENYLYLSGNSLTLVSAGGGWTIDGVWGLAGDRSRAGWLTSDGRVWLFDWVSDPTQTPIVSPEAVGLLVGQNNLYVLGWGEFIEVDGLPLHPNSRVEIYDLDNYRSRGWVDVLAPPEALVEINNYSFLQVEEEVQIIDNQKASVDPKWGFSRVVVDLVVGNDHQGQPVVYILTGSGEVWDFNPQRQTYSLIGAAPSDGSHGHAIPGSLFVAGEVVYFGFEWEETELRETTYRLDLATP